MKVQDFDYDLPPGLIAQQPCTRRDESRLMVLFRNEEKIIHTRFKHLHEFLHSDEVLIINESKVIPARLMGKKKKTGGKVEILVCRPLDRVAGIYKAIANPLKRIRQGTVIEFGAQFQAEVLEKNEEFCHIRFHSGEPLEKLIDRYGETPLPPYITQRNPDDRERYQTIYAKIPGSVAAPTAGLHFSPSVLQQLKNRHIAVEKVILHVGPGTFMPLRGTNVENQKLDEEEYILSEPTAKNVNRIRQKGNALIAAGTTTARVLETCVNNNGVLHASAGFTSLYIYPGYRFKAVDALLTNFHLPKSSLLLLVCAFAGKKFIFDAYQTAISKGYRFYSYGDAMLIR